MNMGYIKTFPKDVLIDYLMKNRVFKYKPKDAFYPKSEITLYMCIIDITDELVNFSVYNETNNVTTKNEPKDVYEFMEEWLEFCEEEGLEIITDISLKAKLLLSI